MCLARYAAGTPWYSASFAAGSAAPSGRPASSVHTCTPHSTPSDRRINTDITYPRSGGNPAARQERVGTMLGVMVTVDEVVLLPDHDQHKLLTATLERV